MASSIAPASPIVIDERSTTTLLITNKIKLAKSFQKKFILALYLILLKGALTILLQKFELLLSEAMQVQPN